MENTIKVYLPSFNDTQCAIILDSETIRVYDSIDINTNVTFTDYFINSHYLNKTGNILLTESVECLNSNLITNDFYYRNDLSDILICFLIILLFAFYFPFKIMCRFWKKLG